MSTDDEIREHYARGEERDRLLSPFYALWLAERGYAGHHRDLVALHLAQLSADAAGRGITVESGIADARDLDLADASVDAVLLLGPIYHLPTRDDRVRALAEAARVVQPGGPIFAVAVSRWAARLHGEVAERLGEEFPSMREAVEVVERTGRLIPLVEGSFSAYTHRPDELRDEVRAAGLERADLVGVEGIAFALSDLGERLAEPAQRAIVLDAARALERIPELLGLSPHLLATARRP